MNEMNIFEALGTINTDYLAAAELSIQKKTAEKPNRAWLNHVLVAACLVLVLATVPVVIMIGKNVTSPSVPVITPSDTDDTSGTPNGVVTTPQIPETTVPTSPLLAIPGAEILKDTSILQNDNNGLAPSFKPEDERVALVKSQTAFTGTVLKESSVLVNNKENGANWYFTLLTIDVDEAFGNMDKSIEQITVITASSYNADYRATGITAAFGDYALLAKESPYGLYVIESANKYSSEHKLSINGEDIDFSDYADYYLFLRYDCDGEKYGYTFRGYRYYLPVSLDKLRSQTTPPDTTSAFKSVTDIPEAQVIEKSDLFDTNAKTKVFFSSPDEMIKRIKSNIGLLGTVSAYSSVLVKDHDSSQYWHITVMKIAVDEAICNMDDTKTITAIFACPYSETESGYLIDPHYIHGDYGFQVMDTPYTYYELQSAENLTLEINGETYKLSDYADYYLINRFDYDGQKIGLTYHKMPYYLSFDLDEIRKTPIEE